MASDADGPDLLPPTSVEGPARFTMSLGWTGGHGEAVLDEDRGIRTRDGLPIFVDGRSSSEIEARVDLSGSFRGSPVVRVAGTVRVAPRKERNSSIPGAPRERFLALEVLSLDAVRVVGERIP